MIFILSDEINGSMAMEGRKNWLMDAGSGEQQVASGKHTVISAELHHLLLSMQNFPKFLKRRPVTSR